MTELLFYDIEVFKYDSLIVFKREDGNDVAHFWNINGHAAAGDYVQNGFERVKDVINERDDNGVLRWTLCGFNNHNYDDLILYGMINGYPQARLKQLNDAIITGDAQKLPEYRLARKQFDTIDAMQELPSVSLKQYEANVGKSIIETAVTFNINRPLTQIERRETLKYCRYDVLSTIDIYARRKASYFDVKAQLIRMLTGGWQGVKKTNTGTISASIIMQPYIDRMARAARDNGRPFDYSSATLQRYFETMQPERANKLLLPEYTGAFDLIPADVWQAWQTNTDVKHDVQIGGLIFTLGLGGGHGVPVGKAGRFEHVINFDVASMYPTILVNLDILPEIYDRIRRERIAIKKSDPVKAAAYKLILNSVYGNLKNAHSKLFNPMAAVSVCAYGQIALIDACSRLINAGYQPINANTDGIYFIDPDGIGDSWRTIQAEWERDYNLQTDAEFYDVLIQKDVNNYCAIADDGHIKAKGGDVGKYGGADVLKIADAPILDRAIVDNLLKGTPVADTITAGTSNPALYQFILKKGKAERVIDATTGAAQQNVNRVFAVKPEYSNAKLCREMSSGSIAKFPDAPDNMKVFNDDLSNYDAFKNEIDTAYYIELAERKLKGWRE